MEWEYYDRLIGKTPQRYDVTPIFEDPEALKNLRKDMTKLISRINFNKIVAIDSLGFVLGTAIALQAKKPLILARKGGKLPYGNSEIVRVTFRDYSEAIKVLEMRKGAIEPGDRALVADEWVETGSQVRAVIKLIRMQRAKVTGIIAINADRNRKTRLLFSKYNLKTLNPGTYRRTKAGYGPGGI